MSNYFRILQQKKYFDLFSYSATNQYDVFHFQKTSDSSNESDILSRLGFHKQTPAPGKYTLHWSQTGISTKKTFFTENTKKYYYQKILLSHGLVIYIKVRMLKSQDPGLQPKAKVKAGH